MSQGIVTIEGIIEQMEYQGRLRLAGTVRQPILDPAVILWIRHRNGSETWEVMGEWEANLIVSDLHNDATVERAAVYQRIPKTAPLDVAARWLRARLEALQR